MAVLWHESGTDMNRGKSDLQLLTVNEVAEILRVSNMTVYRLIKSGGLAAIRVGKNYRVRSADLDAYLAAGSVQLEQTSG